VTPADILAELESVVELGYSVSDRDVVPGIASIGAAISDHAGRVCAALSMGGLREQVLGEDLASNVELIVTGAAEISNALGAPGDARAG
jgi:IclR family acetate operon transcriptional repressor